jgi:hypothetical protein
MTSCVMVDRIGLDLSEMEEVMLIDDWRGGRMGFFSPRVGRLKKMDSQACIQSAEDIKIHKIKERNSKMC